MESLIKKIEKEITKREKQYNSKYTEYKKSIPFDKDFGDGRIYESAMKIAENKKKLKDALNLIIEVNKNEQRY